MRLGEGPRSARLLAPEPGAPVADSAGAPPTSPPAESADAAAPSPFALLLRRLGREVDRGEALTRRAIEGGGKDLGTGELLALQAGVYRYSEAVDLSAKLVDRAANGVKTVLQGQ